jgi:phosphoglycolate phosphatase
MIKAVLFDLDGTLCDTALDLLHALNHSLMQAGYPCITLTQAQVQVSFGARAMIRFALAQVDPKLAEDDARVEAIAQPMLAYYQAHPAWHTRLFTGIDLLLAHLADRQMPWGVVTNKPQAFSEAILNQLQLAYPPSCFVGGDRLSVNKPDPAPLLLAAELCTTAPEQCVYIGDHARDIIAAKAAGMPSIAVGYGYLSPEDNPYHWGADWVAHTPRQLQHIIQERLS